MKSLYSGVSGLKTHNQRMDVIGNNIANVNTTAYKTSTVTFKDVFYQNKTNASSGDALTGGTNANQVGYGVSLGTISQVMTQSGFTTSDRVTDCAIEGEGFFQVMDEAGNIFYTRAGVFTVDNYGNLTDPNGNIVLGVSGDPTGVEASSQRINLYVPSVLNNAANAEKSVNGHVLRISASTYGEDGNLSFAILDADSPFATLNGTTLTIEMDLDQDFATAEEFETAVNNAITAGGVTLPDGVLPLNFDFETLPADTQAAQASNTLSVVTASDANSSTTLDFTFTAVEAGEAANGYEINIKSTTATTVSARWSDEVLIISVPDTGNFTEQQIQDAINQAAGMTRNPDNSWNEASDNEQQRLIVDMAQTVTTFATGATTTTDLAAAATVSGADFAAVLDGTTARVGLAGGADNFFADVATALGTVKLTDGRLAEAQTTQDLESIFIDDSGVIYGVHAVHGTIAMGRIDLVTFENPTGLNQVGTSYWQESLSSGVAEVKLAGQDGAGNVVSGALEMSNVDLSQEFSDMIITQRGFQANSRIITVSDTMLEELVNLKR